MCPLADAPQCLSGGIGNALCELLVAAGSPAVADAVAAEIAASVPAAGWAVRRRAFALLAAADAEVNVWSLF